MSNNTLGSEDIKVFFDFLTRGSLRWRKSPADGTDRGRHDGDQPDGVFLGALRDRRRLAGPASCCPQHRRAQVSGATPAEVALVVRYQALPGKGDEVAALLSRHAAATQAEPGCRAFVALRAARDADAFVLYEHYDSPAAVDAHLQSAHYLGLARDQIRPLLAERTVEQYLPIMPAGRGG
jgi:quinol monooxygenase YgiN